MYTHRYGAHAHVTRKIERLCNSSFAARAESDGHLSGQDRGQEKALPRETEVTSWEASLPTLRLVPNQIHTVCFRGGQTKPRALRLDAGDIPQCSEGPKCKIRVTDVV